ncbi:MAG: ATPase, T2SS/T4P/T4SS family, partial [Planctomycetota bacterium]
MAPPPPTPAAQTPGAEASASGAGGVSSGAVVPTDTAPSAGWTDLKPSSAFVREIPIAFARRHAMLGLEDTPAPGNGSRGAAENSEGGVLLAMADPGQLDLSENVARRLGVAVRVVGGDEAEIQTAINRAYEQKQGEVGEVVASIDPHERAAVLAELQGMSAGDDLLDSGGRSPVIKLVNLMLAEAVRARASDVHVQPYEHHVVARMRIDGVLYDTFELPKAVQEEAISRIKVMARMDIAEKRLPQDGRVPVRVGDRTIDLRVSTLPTSFGERVVIRLLDKSQGLLSLDDLNLPAQTDATFRGMIHGEHGILL